MSYKKQNFYEGQTLTHKHLNNIEDGIIELENNTATANNTNYWNGKKMIWNGDSISYGSWLSSPTTQAYPILVGNALGMKTYNFAIGGSYAAKPEGSFDEYYWDYSKWQEDVVNGVVDTNKKYLVKNNPGAAKPCKIYYYDGSSWKTNSDSGGWAIVERMKEMVALHPDADVIGIAIGTNDFYTAQCPFGEIDAANYRNLQILRENAAGEVETVEKISNINLVDDLIVIDDYAELTENSSVVTEAENTGVALMVPVIGGKKYYSPNATWCWYYDSEQNPISSIHPTNNGGYITTPNNATYMSLTFLMSELADDSAGLYEILLVSNDTRENLLDKATLVEGKSLSSSSYTLTDNEGYYVYQEIPIIAGKTYEVSNGYRAWFLKSDKSSLSTINISKQSNKFQAPANAAYISITFAESTSGEPEKAYVKCIDGLISEEEETLTKSTYCGSIHTICKYLLTNYKNKDIFFITPIKRYQPGTWDCKYPEDKNKLGYTLKDYSDAIIEICSYYSIPVIDFYSISGLNPHIDTSLFGDTDDKAVHPNLEGHKRMASLVVAYLQSLRK
jgi:lysophospholipase L1-like esterase